MAIIVDYGFIGLFGRVLARLVGARPLPSMRGFHYFVVRYLRRAFRKDTSPVVCTNSVIIISSWRG